MGTEDSTAPLTAIDVSPASSEVNLSTFDVAALRQDFERLSVDDLTALASFPVEPHELIGRVVAVTHCLLLSLSPEHTALELRAPPWPLLRLQMLDNTTKIWRKLRKRAWQLENGVKSLSPVQVRFGCKELLPFIQRPKPQHHRYDRAWQLDRLAQVSTIAASLGAWIVFCLCCSVSPSLIHLDSDTIIQPIPSIKLSPHCQSARKQDPRKNAQAAQLKPIEFNRFHRSSRRFGIKVGGRFLLFHAQFSSSRLAVAADTLGEWSIYCLAGIRIGRQRHKLPGLEHNSSSSESYSLHASWWKPHHAIEMQTSRATHPLALCHMTPLAQRALLLQLGSHERIFERPAQDMPHVKTPQSSPPVYTLKFVVVEADSRSQLSLMSIGNIWITMETTVADLRTLLTPIITSRVLNIVDHQVSFRLLYRGSFLAVSQERQLAAVALLPFVTFVTGDNCQVKQYRMGKQASKLYRHHCEVAQSLVNSGLPDDIPQAEGLQLPGPTISSIPQVFAMRQPFVSSVAQGSSRTIKGSTSSVVVELFTHWRGFVCFQQMQYSSVLFQLPQRSPQKQTKSPQKSPKPCRNNDHTDARDESVLYGPRPQPLPRKKFKHKKEWLLPLYAVADVVSPTAAVLKTPFHSDVQILLASTCRLVLAEEANVIHFARINRMTVERDAFGANLTVLDIAFLRDESCSLESLVTLKGVYVWLVVSRKVRSNREVHLLPTEWMVDLYQFVQHPTYDFQSPNCQQANHFRVRVPWNLAERVIESAFWSKDVDWAPSVSFTDLYSTVLRQIFDALCRSHPPAFGVDSVKFSKLLYEANIQPALLSIGDAAFLFTSNLTPGFTYEMDFNGFVRAVEWLAQQFYSESGKKGKVSPIKMVPGIQHAIMKWQLSRRERGARDHLVASLRRFCYETLVHLPSLTSTWHDIMDSWRLVRKQQLLQEYALKYCAATRLRAGWIGLITWRIFLQRRERMREGRLAATRLQSVARGRKHYLEYHRVRHIVTRTQRWIHARFKLRRHRAERSAFVEHMRIRIVKWMCHHLWLLREWKRLNAAKAARRDRIREKRLRRIGVAVFPLDTWRLRFSLYRVKPIDTESAPVSDSEKTAGQQTGSNEAYELEVVDPARSWGHAFYISQQQLDQFIAEESERHALQLQSGLSTVAVSVRKLPSGSVSALMMTSRLPRGRKQGKSSIVRDSVVHPMLSPNVMLLALAQRIFVPHGEWRGHVGLRCYSDPAYTSLGKLIFKGAIRSEFAHGDDKGDMLVQRHVVRVLEWTGTFKFLMYTPVTSTRLRYDLDVSFLLSVLKFSRFRSMRLSIPEGEDDAIAADREEQLKNCACGPQQVTPYYQIHRILNGSHKVLALQCIISYLLKHGVRAPTYSMMPDVIAEQKRQREERESKQHNTMLLHEQQLIVKVQACWRRNLARTNRLQLALASYRMEFDRDSGRFVYIQLYKSGARVVLGERKPLSLFDQDVPLPPDEWQLVFDSDNISRFLNPRRGVYSRYNDILAATTIQRWFRGKMWNGINNWKLHDIARALHYHSDIQKPTNMADLGQLENIKRYALQLHVLQHQYKAAYSMYEAALKLSPDDPQTLVLLAILLVISCRYPTAQSWQRAMMLLQQARDLVGEDFTSMLHEVEQNAFRWALFLQPKNPHAIANYAVYLQCVHLDIDKAELLYRRALDLDPVNDLFVTNFQRLQSERAPGRMYSIAGPGKIALARSSEICRFGSESQWREMEDPAAQPAMPTRFFHDLRTGKCTWEPPQEDQSLALTADQREALPLTK